VDEVRKARLQRRLKTLREAKAINGRAQVVIEAQVSKHPTGTVTGRTDTGGRRS
jgi:hypothetical protein